MDKAIKWVMRSSENPENISATLKNIVPFLLLLGVGEADVALLQEGVLAAIVGVGTAITGLTTLWALGRKLYKTLNGTNKAIQ